jgi:hypothetical protein
MFSRNVGLWTTWRYNPDHGNHNGYHGESSKPIMFRDILDYWLVDIQHERYAKYYDVHKLCGSELRKWEVLLKPKTKLKNLTSFNYDSDISPFWIKLIIRKREYLQPQ